MNSKEGNTASIGTRQAFYEMASYFQYIFDVHNDYRFNGSDVIVYIVFRDVCADDTSQEEFIRSSDASKDLC